jgi:hypothetical protein
MLTTSAKEAGFMSQSRKRKSPPKHVLALPELEQSIDAFWLRRLRAVAVIIGDRASRIYRFPRRWFEASSEFWAAALDYEAF